MKKLLYFLFFLILIISNFPINALAIGATSSAAFVPEIAPAPALSAAEQILQRLPDPLILKDSAVASPSPSFPTAESVFSAGIKSPPIIRSLSKRSFRSDEKIEINIDNADNSGVSVSILDKNGQEANFDYFTTDNGSQKIVTVKPKRQFTPGKYSIKITTGGQTYTQDFMWGVLAINTNKSIYLQNETAKLSMAVLDESGNVICDAKVSLNITDPSGNQTSFSTGNGSIAVNPVCKQKDVTSVPDYESNYQVSGPGIYAMKLSAVTKNGSYSISDTFEVRNSVFFDVERITATRIYPPNSYPVNINITANRDFNGIITEAVPGDFAIDQLPASAYPFKEVKTLSPTAAGQVLGASSLVSLSLPFKGNFPIGEEFGEKLKDGVEKNLYARFNLAGHDGVDFDMINGTPVLAADDGKVVMAGGKIYGTTIVIEHSWGKSYYGHLNKVNVSLGQIVKKGENIGFSGNTGLSTGPHLHFGIKPNNPDMRNGYYGKIDPLPFLGIQSQLDAANQVKLISYEVSLKKGDKITLGYLYKAPNISPQFYTLGPISFVENSQVLFKEVRRWQIAADVVAFRAAGTVVTGDQVTSMVLTKPTGTVSTDVLIAMFVGADGTSDVYTPPAGWTLINRTNSTTALSTASYWALGSVASTTWSVTQGLGGQANLGFILGYSGVDNTTPIDATAVAQANASSVTITSPSITTVTANAWLVGVMGIASLSTFSAPFGTTRQSGNFSSQNGGNIALAGIDASQSVAGASGTKTVTASIAGVNVGQLIALRPSGGVITPRLDQLMRHGKWFNAGVEQPFTF